MLIVFFSFLNKNNYYGIVIYLIIINVALFGLVLFFHEIGHLAVAVLLGCVGLISFSNFIGIAGPTLFAQIVCSETLTNSMIVLISLGGFLITAPLSITFLFLKGRPEKSLVYVAFGLMIFFSGLDLEFILNNTLAAYFSLILGTALICIGEAGLAVEHSRYFRHANRAVMLAAKVRGRAS